MTRKQRKNLVKIILSAVLLAVMIFLPIKPWYIKLLLFLIPYAIVGFDVLWTAARHLIHGRLFDEQFLMSVATIGAFALGEYTEAVAVMLFYQVGELFQSIAVGKSRKNIAKLMEIRPESAVVLRNGSEETVSPSEVEKGETILIRPGERIPLDGVIEEGTTAIDAAALTGESIPVEKKKGDRVVSGTVNLTGVIRVITESVYEDSTVAKILELTENAASKKAKTENFITRFAKYYTPAVVIGAVLLAILPSLFTGEWTVWIRRALIFLVVSCPCALVISVPLSFFGGIGGASKKGILIKGSQALERLAELDTVAFDKTGTLTKGVFSVTGVFPTRGSKEELLTLAAFAESGSNHPIAKSIVAACPQTGKTGIWTEHSGMGIEAQTENDRIFAGNTALMAKAGVPDVPSQSGTAVHIACNGEYKGYIIVEDTLKEDAPFAMEALKQSGIGKTVMLTGDKKEIAEQIGKALRIDEIHAELLPHQKVEAVETLMTKGAKLAFAGDGINDAPVLARADVSVAMGAMGSDAAIEAADVVLMDDKLSGIAKAIATAKKTMRIVRQNIWFALLVKGAVLLLGALGLTNMWTAVFADVGVAVLAILNAMRAMR